MATLDEIRAKLKEKQDRKGGNFSIGDNAIYPFWNIPDDQMETYRFLPDNDESNPFFWRERLMIRLPFSGIKGQHQDNVVVQVPCVEMYGKTCPILTEVRTWYKAGDPDLEKKAGQYWKKRSYLFQGFVVNGVLNEDNPPENPIRRFVINQSIFKIIENGLMDPDMDALPTDYENGYDFRLKKTKNGQYADYGTSKWAAKPRALTAEELEAIETYGLYDLKEFLPKEPSDDAIELLGEMFEASVNGEEYDPAWAVHFRAPGMSNNDDSNSKTVSKPVAKPAPAPVASDEEEEEVTETKSAEKEKEPEAKTEGKRSAADILEQLKKARNSG